MQYKVLKFKKKKKQLEFQGLYCELHWLPESLKGGRHALMVKGIKILMKEYSWTGGVAENQA